MHRTRNAPFDLQLAPVLRHHLIEGLDAGGHLVSTERGLDVLRAMLPAL